MTVQPPAIDASRIQIVRRDSPPEEANVAILSGRLGQFLGEFRAYLRIQSPTAPQTVTVVKALCGVAIALVRLRLAKFDAVD